MLTGLNNAYTAGNLTTEVFLNKTTLKSQLGVTDPYWADTSNWRRVVIVFRNSLDQVVNLSFVGDKSDLFRTGSKAANGSYKMEKVSIFDNDGGIYSVNRWQYPSAFSTHDVTLSGGISPGSVISSGLISRLNPSFANLGVSPYSENTLSAEYYSMLGPNANLGLSVFWNTQISSGGVLNGVWMGNGTKESPYRTRIYGSVTNIRYKQNIILNAGSNFTFSFWIRNHYPDSYNAFPSRFFYAPASGYSYLIEWHRTGSGQGSFVCNLQSGSQSFHYANNLNKWVNFSVVRNGLNLYYYANGDSFGTAPVYGPRANNAASIAAAATVPDASFGEILIYNTALSSDQVLENYNVTKSIYGL